MMKIVRFQQKLVERKNPLKYTDELENTGIFDLKGPLGPAIVSVWAGFTTLTWSTNMKCYLSNYPIILSH